MVKGLLVSFAVAAIVVAGCSDSDNPQEAANKADSIITLADTATAPLVPFNASNRDSFVLRLKPGQSFRYRVRQFAEAGPDSAVATTKSVHVYTKTVRAVRSDGSYEIAMRFDTIVVDFEARNRKTGALIAEQRYSSKDSTQRTRADLVQFNALLGEEVSIYVAPNGAIIEVGDVSPIVKKMMSATKQEPPPAALAQFSEQIKQGIYASFYGQENIPFPKNGIDSTGSWTNTNTTPLADLFMVSSSATYRIGGYREVRGKRIAEIHADLSGSFAVRKAPAGSPITVRLANSTITGSSQSVLDVERGFTVSKKNEIKMSVEAIVTVAKQSPRRVAQAQYNRYEIELLP